MISIENLIFKERTMRQLEDLIKHSKNICIKNATIQLFLPPKSAEKKSIQLTTDCEILNLKNIYLKNLDQYYIKMPYLKTLQLSYYSEGFHSNLNIFDHLGLETIEHLEINLYLNDSCKYVYTSLHQNAPNFTSLKSITIELMNSGQETFFNSIPFTPTINYI